MPERSGAYGRDRAFFDFWRSIESYRITMPKFTKTEDELETHFDKWLYIIKNLPRLQERLEIGM